jgi:hypothetical protein
VAVSCGARLFIVKALKRRACLPNIEIGNGSLNLLLQRAISQLPLCKHEFFALRAYMLGQVVKSIVMNLPDNSKLIHNACDT